MKALCRAIIWNACFLELSDESVVELESAVRTLENMASTLQGATEEEKEVFIQTCAEEASHLEKEGSPGYARTAEFIRELPESLGLC
jgi:hypothetical protein